MRSCDLDESSPSIGRVNIPFVLVLLHASYLLFQDTELLLAQLEKDQEAVDQVREIVQKEEAIMKKETQVVQDYADVS